jgi:hypothetical protein
MTAQPVRQPSWIRRKQRELTLAMQNDHIPKRGP